MTQGDLPVHAGVQTMPPRLISLLIVLSWLGVAGWFGYREYGARFFGDNAPPFVIDLADEATLRGPPMSWVILRNGERIGRATTRITYDERADTFELISEWKEVRLMEIQRIAVTIPQMTNQYRVTRDGRLRALSLNGRLKLGETGLEAFAAFQGDVVNDRLERRGYIELPAFLGRIEPKFEPVKAPNGSVLNPLHPVPRVLGLRPGRRWRMPQYNPLADAVAPTVEALSAKLGFGAKGLRLSNESGTEYLNAEVLRDLQTIEVLGRTHECFVIEYRGKSDSPPSRTYVSRATGAVLRQEANSMDLQFVMQRD